MFLVAKWGILFPKCDRTILHQKEEGLFFSSNDDELKEGNDELQFFKTFLRILDMSKGVSLFSNLESSKKKKGVCIDGTPNKAGLQIL